MVDDSVVEFAWSNFLGQKDVLKQLSVSADSPTHAYLFLGSTGLFEAAKRFAGLVLASSADDPMRAVRLCKELNHPDLILVEPEGSTLRVTDAEQVIRVSSTTPVEFSKKVVIIPAVDQIEENAIGKLLKVVEEPPESTVFILLAQNVLPEIITIASRCSQVKFAPYSQQELETYLVSKGADAKSASLAALASGGIIERAELVVADSGLAERSELWSNVPKKLDGRGVTLMGIIKDVQAGFDSALTPLVERQQIELEELDARAAELGERGSGRSSLISRHKREARKLRSDELRFGFALLSRHYRDVLLADSGPGDEKHAHAAIASIQDASESLVRNPNETLMLQNLLIQLEP